MQLCSVFCKYPVNGLSYIHNLKIYIPTAMTQGKVSWDKTVVLLISVKISLEILQKYMIMWRQLVLEEAHANGDAGLNKIYIEHVKINVICFIHKLCVCVCVYAQSYPTLCNPTDCSLAGSSVHGILQARKFEWVAIPFSRGSSQTQDWTQVSCIADRFFTAWATREALYSSTMKPNPLIKFHERIKGTLNMNCKVLAWNKHYPTLNNLCSVSRMISVVKL